MPPTPADEQRQIVTLARDFTKREIEPVASELDRQDAYPEGIMQGLRELGLMGSTIPAEYGGLELDPVTLAMVVEELAKGWMSIPVGLTSHLTLATLVQLYGTADQKQRFLPSMASGELFGGVAFTEADCGSDLAAVQTSAKRDGDVYRVNGTKLMITNGHHGSIFATLVRTGGAVGHKGLSLLLIEKRHGAKAGRHLEKLGFRGIDTTELLLDDVEVPLTNLLGMEEGLGFKQVMRGLEGGRINIAASAVGVAMAAFERSIAYAQRRESMGRPIAEHQAIQLHLAEMYTEIEAARLLVHNAARVRGEGQRADLEAGMAKLFASEVAAKVTLTAMRIHGGYGYFNDSVVERYFRDAPLTILGEGSNEIQRLVIARNLLRRYSI